MKTPNKKPSGESFAFHPDDCPGHCLCFDEDKYCHWCGHDEVDPALKEPVSKPAPGQGVLMDTGRDFSREKQPLMLSELDAAVIMAMIEVGKYTMLASITGHPDHEFFVESTRQWMSTSRRLSVQLPPDEFLRMIASLAIHSGMLDESEAKAEIEATIEARPSRTAAVNPIVAQALSAILNGPPSKGRGGQKH